MLYFVVEVNFVVDNRTCLTCLTNLAPQGPPWGVGTGKRHGQMKFLSGGGTLRRKARSIALWSLRRLGQQVWMDVEWPFGDEPLLNLGWMLFMGIFGGCWSCFFNLSTPPSCGEKKKLIRRKQKPNLWKMKRRIKSWENASKKLVTVLYSCRFVKKRRLKRSKRQRQVLQKFVWWCPQKYRHYGSSVKIILGKQSQNWPKWTYPDSGSEIKKCKETNLHIQTAHMNRTELSGGAGGKAASRRKRQQNQESQVLADALTEFLHNWTRLDQRRQQTKGTSKSGDTSLARKLIAVL